MIFIISYLLYDNKVFIRCPMIKYRKYIIQGEGMSVKDDLNKGFTIGDVTTVNFDDDAKIKVKDFYELDRLERTKILELAGRVDIELVKRDTNIESINENVSNLESDVIEVKKSVTSIEDRVEDIENNGTGGESLKAYYSEVPSGSNPFIFYKFEVPQEELDKLGELSLENYNKLALSDQTTIKNVLAKIGISDPTDLESLRNELLVSGSQVGGLILKVYGNSIRIPINKAFTFIVPDRVGLTKIAVKCDVLDVVLAKLPNGKYDSTHSTAIGSVSNPRLTSIYAEATYPNQNIGSDAVYLINYLKDELPSNEFGIRINGTYSSTFDKPYSITGTQMETVPFGTFNTVNSFQSGVNSKSITVSDTNYGAVDKFTTRTVRIGAQGRYLSYDVTVRYNADVVASAIILDNLPAWYVPHYNNTNSKGIDFNIYGSDGTVMKGELTGGPSGGRMVHNGSLKSGITYTAKFQVKGAFQ